MIPYGCQTIGDAEIDAVVRVLRSPMLTQGDMAPSFENAVAQAVNAPYAVAVNSATAALHIACLALDLGPGDRLWTVPNTFVASANAGIYCGASVDFVDINPRSYNIDVDALELKLAAAAIVNAVPKVLVPVHFAGQSCEMERIAALADRYGFAIIEDASHAVGAKYQGKPVGDCRYCDIAVFSFHPVKIITTGEGGMCLTKDVRLAERLRRLRSHGITRDPALCARSLDGQWDYRQIELGYNYRMTDIQAALGVAQLARLGEFLTRRRAIAARYGTLLSDLPVVRPWQHSDTHTSWHLYVIQVEAAARRPVFDYLRANGIGVQVLYIPVHRQPYYERQGFRAGQFPQSEAYYGRSFTLPIFPTLTDAQQDEIVTTLAAGLAAVSVS